MSLGSHFDGFGFKRLVPLQFPNRGEQMVRYYGYYSNKCRGQRKKAGSGEIEPSGTEPTASFASRKSLAHLIQKI